MRPKPSLINLKDFTPWSARNKRASKANSMGFTIIELLVATTVFSVALVIFLSAFIRVGQMFYKGVNIANTQEAARTMLQDVSDDIQFYNEAPIIGTNYFCIGNHRYVYNLHAQVQPGTFGIAKQNIGCPSPANSPVPTDPSQYEELLGPEMQVNKLNIGCNNKLCTVNLLVVYYGSDKHVFFSSLPGYINDTNDSAYNADQAPDARCTGVQNDTQFCATADYSSTILQSF
jgi:hypothetical protein